MKERTKMPNPKPDKELIDILKDRRHFELQELYDAVIEWAKSKVPNKKEVPTKSQIKDLTEKGISIAVEAVQFHAYNQAIQDTLEVFEK